jgi:hypothetical protein
VLVSRRPNELIERDAMQQRRDVRKFYASLSDSELITVWALGRDKADDVVMADAEAELARRGARSNDPEVRLRTPRESIARTRSRT